LKKIKVEFSFEKAANLNYLVLGGQWYEASLAVRVPWPHFSLKIRGSVEIWRHDVSPPKQIAERQRTKFIFLPQLLKLLRCFDAGDALRLEIAIILAAGFRVTTFKNIF
jgi:hypothetical protein